VLTALHRAAACAVLAGALTGGGVIAAEPQATWVQVIAPAAPGTEELALEIGGRTYPIPREGGSGVVSRPGTESVVVRLVSTNCRVFVSFDAPPGTAHVIRLEPGGAVEVRHLPDLTIDSGPALEEGAPLNCDRNLAESPKPERDNQPWLLVGAVVGVVIAFIGGWAMSRLRIAR
jgi:hypothetical protein